MTVTVEVSPRLVGLIHDACVHSRIDFHALSEGVTGLGRGKVPWDSVVTLFERLEVALGGPEALEREGYRSNESPVVESFRVTVGAFASPRLLYKAIVVWFGPALMPFVHATCDNLPDGRIRIEMTIPDDLRGCAEFFRLTQGAYRGLPQVLGQGDSVVVAEISLRHAVYLITPPPDLTLLARVRRGARALVGAPHLLDELGKQQSEIGLSYTALLESKRSLENEIVEHRRTASALRQREELFRGLLDAAPDATVVASDRGSIQLANRQAVMLFGYSQTELVGKPVEILFASRLQMRREDELPELAADAWVRSLEGARELRAVRKDGTEFPVDVSLSPMAGEEGQLVSVAIRDVSDRKRTEAQLLVSDRMASIGTLAAGVAHEINNPLAAVMANVSLAAEELAEISDTPGLSVALGEIRDQLHDAFEAAERVRNIVRDLGLFSRSEDERTGAVDVHRVLESTLRMASHQIRHRARLVKRYGEIPLVEASESRLGQVFLNLLVNASQAIDEGAVETHEIRIATFCDVSGSVIVEISDNGRGIPADVLPRLFTPFFTTKAVGIGTGLGLSICHRIVTGFGGSIEVTSEVGKGSVVRVSLPAAPTDEVRRISQVAPPITHAKRRGKILVVDDEETIGRVVSRVLSPEHDVVAVSAAKDALGRIRAGEVFDVILCDLMMPQMTGMEFHAELQHTGDDAEKIVFLTGGAFTPAAKAFFEHTENVRVQKPFDAQSLRDLINGRVR